MSDDLQKTTTPPASMKVQGRDVPFPANAFADKDRPDGVDPETMLFQGIHPDTNKRVSVTIDGLKAEFGDELGEKKYVQIAGIAGGSIFFNPGLEASNYRPPLGIGDLKGKHKDKVEEILAAKE